MHAGAAPQVLDLGLDLSVGVEETQNGESE